MPNKKIYDLSVKTGSYQKNGETKGKYSNVGVVIEKEDGGKFMMIDPHFNFAAIRREEGKNMVIVSMFPPKTEEVKPATEDISWAE